MCQFMGLTRCYKTIVFYIYCSFSHGYFVLYMAIRPLWPQSWSINDLTWLCCRWRRGTCWRSRTTRVAIRRPTSAVVLPSEPVLPSRKSTTGTRTGASETEAEYQLTNYRQRHQHWHPLRYNLQRWRHHTGQQRRHSQTRSNHTTACKRHIFLIDSRNVTVDVDL